MERLLNLQLPSRDFDILVVDVVVFATLLLLPITTILSALFCYPIGHPLKLRRIAIVLAVWIAMRLFLTTALLQDPHLLSMHDENPGPVFAGFSGLLACLVASAVGLILGLSALRERRAVLQYLAFSVCLSPLLVMIWVLFELNFGFVAIDYVIAAVTLGWSLSAISRSRGIQAEPLEVPNENAYPRFATSILRIGGFFVLTILPAILCKWTFHEILGLRQDGSLASWLVIWTVALLLGLTAFAVSSIYELRNRAQQIAVVAFLCAFAIMIFNWGSEYDPGLESHINAFGAFQVMPILALGTLSMMATVILDKHRWTWPFWSSWMFAYIFVHSVAGSGYVKEISKFALFSWMNLSAVVFVFLFATTIYFASGRGQDRTRLATADGLSG